VTITLPDTTEGLENWVSEPANLEEMFKDGKPTKVFGDWTRAFGAAHARKNADVKAQIVEQVKATTIDWLQTNQAAGAVPAQRLPQASEVATDSSSKIRALSRFAGQYNPTASGAGLDQHFEGDAGTRDYLRAIFHGNVSKGRYSDQRDKIEQVVNSLSSNVPADGGFLIPERLRAELLRVSLETSLVRPRARVIPMDSPIVPFPSLDSTSNASSVYGGVVGYWTEESATLAESQPKFGRVKLEAHKLTAYSEVPNELFADSIISLQAFIGEAFPEALGWFEDLAFINGSGVGQPLGFMRADAAVSAAAEGGQPATTIAWENIVKMYSRMLPSSLSRAVWVANIDTFPELATMALSIGTGGSAIWLNNGQDGPPARILGRPVYFTEKVPTLGTVGDINFVDLGYYLIGDRQQMQTMTSEHYQFRNDRTAMRFIERVDGRPWLTQAITPNQGANTLSPFVKLATR
jgi:HK97 family phage major capsid protein